MSFIFSVIAYLALLSLLAIISATETAIHMARDLELQADRAREGVARKLRRIVANPFVQLHRTLLLSATLNLALAALGLHLVSGPMVTFGWNPWIAASLLFIGTVLIGDMMPKFLAARSPSAVLLGSLRMLNPLRSVLDPISTLADRSTEALIRRIVPQRVKTRLPITLDEFETLVEMREEQGLLDSAEASMIREALEIERLTVRDCMVPRVDLTLMSAFEKPEKNAAVLEQSAERYVVVYGENPDVVEGIIDTVAWRLAGRPAWANMLRPVAFVPETMPVLDVLDEHLQSSPQPVLIVDEYGGLEGMIGQDEIADWLLYEAAPWQGEGAEIRDLGNGRYLLEGGTRLDDVAEELQIALPASGGLDTIGGLVFNLLGHQPKPGERVHLDEADLKVRRVVRARILQVELRLKKPTLVEALES
ncbi:Hemolysin, contains CBS domains [Prosthecobacter debontii]|uniref:Hemolysin, contains CBS domains n=1 Tax=Prosthecobacter debontii TaxID=48467 RepID=A0A1T4YYP9_9BACT|nr:CNNM domain-containing protein [Prosthecobacter debontii]SKB06856.1 Hemolysin, contains CBS domains [Prosthecobacter debontii]